MKQLDLTDGISREDTFAIVDGMNDAEILEFAMWALPWAMRSRV